MEIAAFVGVTVDGKPLLFVREIDEEKRIAVGVIPGEKEGYDIVRERDDVGYRYFEVRGEIKVEKVLVLEPKQPQ